MNLLRLMLAAEMLKPASPAVKGEDKQVVEYSPHLLLVHNKAESTELGHTARQNMESLYSSVFCKSRLASPSAH